MEGLLPAVRIRVGRTLGSDMGEVQGRRIVALLTRNRRQVLQVSAGSQVMQAQHVQSPRVGDTDGPGHLSKAGIVELGRHGEALVVGRETVAAVGGRGVALPAGHFSGNRHHRVERGEHRSGGKAQGVAWSRSCLHAHQWIGIRASHVVKRGGRNSLCREDVDAGQRVAERKINEERKATVESLEQLRIVNHIGLRGRRRVGARHRLLPRGQFAVAKVESLQVGHRQAEIRHEREQRQHARRIVRVESVEGVRIARARVHVPEVGLVHGRRKRNSQRRVVGIRGPGIHHFGLVAFQQLRRRRLHHDLRVQRVERGAECSRFADRCCRNCMPRSLAASTWKSGRPVNVCSATVPAGNDERFALVELIEFGGASAIATIPAPPSHRAATTIVPPTKLARGRLALVNFAS